MEDYRSDEVRYCCNYKCRRKITKSDGGVLVRDLLEFMETGKRPGQVRELCSKCSMTIDPHDIK